MERDSMNLISRHMNKSEHLYIARKYVCTCVHIYTNIYICIHHLYIEVNLYIIHVLSKHLWVDSHKLEYMWIPLYLHTSDVRFVSLLGNLTRLLSLFSKSSIDLETPETHTHSNDVQTPKTTAYSVPYF